VTFYNLLIFSIDILNIRKYFVNAEMLST